MPGTDKKESPFLRRAAVVPRRRKRPFTLRLIIGAALSIAAVVGLARFAASPRFALRRFEVVGNTRARTEEILETVAGWTGKNLIALDLAPMAVRLSGHPWVERVTLSKRFPDGLVVRVTERRALALYRDETGFWWVGAGGHLIAPYDPRRDRTEYVIVTGERRALPEAVALIEELRAARPDYVAALSEIASLPDGGFGMMDAIFRKPVRVLRADAPAKIGALLEARGFVESRGWEARAIDLRFADRIILVGAYGAGNRL
ncbi:MAG TPA: FtsQ-type POTRA domain-containing protein [Thermoanaerobaculia bacterium]|nr:FtsQ-type POTRA domain-containing protein [Thermoanaerobaculia bacterium]